MSCPQPSHGQRVDSVRQVAHALELHRRAHPSVQLVHPGACARIRVGHHDASNVARPMMRGDAHCATPASCSTETKATRITLLHLGVQVTESSDARPTRHRLPEAVTRLGEPDARSVSGSADFRGSPRRSGPGQKGSAAPKLQLLVFWPEGVVMKTASSVSRPSAEKQERPTSSATSPIPGT